MIEALVLRGWAFELADGQGPAARGEAAEALWRWREGGLAWSEASDGEPLYDPAEVFNHMTWAGLAGDPVWRDRHVKTGRGFVEDLARGAPERRFEARLSRTFNLTRQNLGLRSAGRTLRLRLPLPLDGPDHRVLEVASCGAETTAWQDGRLDLRLADEGRESVSLEAVVSLAMGEATAIARTSAGPSEIWRRPVEGEIRVTPRLAALAERLGGGLPDRDAVAAFWRHLMDSFCSGVVRYDDFAPAAALDWVLDHRWYDCRLGAALLVTLCRARGVAARLVDGYFLYDLYPTRHYWAEVWLADDGWRPMDVFAWDLSAGGEDAAWRDRFFLGLEPRLVLQRPPRRVTGPSSIGFPPSWQMVESPASPGVDISFTDVIDGSLIMRDHVAIRAI